MDICKTKKGINVSQKKFVSRVLVLIRDCSDRQLQHLLPGPGWETVRLKPCVAAVLPAPGILIPRGGRLPTAILSLSGDKKSWELMQCRKHFLNTSGLRMAAANHCYEHIPSAPPPLAQRDLWWHVWDRRELVSPTKYAISWMGYWLPPHPQQYHSCCPTAYLKCKSFHHGPAGGQDILQIITKASE